MLRVTPSADAESALSYFDNGFQKGDYYSTEQEADSFWGGGLGLGFGVYAPNEKVAPTREQFERLVHNKNPVTSEQLTARNVANRRVGYDFTFNAPKSLSIASEVLGQDAVRSSFVDAVQTTMRAVEADMMTRVRKNNQNTNRVTENMLYAGFVHRTSRPVNGIADPHLHAHCFVFNVTHDQEEQQMKAAEIGYIKSNAPYYEALFHSYLAEKLVELGYNIERNGRYVELAGMNRDLIERYSRRTKKIEEIAKEKGIVDAEKKAKLGEKTRENKSANTQDPSELIEGWKSRLATSEEKLFIPSVPIMDRKAPSLKDEVLTKAIEHVFERKSVVSDKDLLAEALRLSYGTATIKDLEEQLKNRTDLIQEADGHGKAIMSIEVLKEEKEVVEFSRKGKGYCEAFSPTTKVTDTFLNKGQKEAITQLWASKDFVTILEGGAGVGKTTLAKVAVEGIEKQGQKVHMFAPSAQASRGVLREDGFKDANTVASLLHNPNKQKALKNNVIWIDEAGLVGTPTMHKILKIAGEQNARVILSGDSKQHKGVERGDALTLLYDHADITPITVREIVRQKGAYKNVVGAIESGNLAEGFGRLNLMGGIVEEDDELGRHQAINKHYLSAIIKNESTLIVAPTHAEKDKVTESLRSYLKIMRRIGMEDKTLATLKDKGLTKGEKQDPLLYKTGTVIKFQKTPDDKNFKKKQLVTVVSPAGENKLNVLSSKGENKVLNLNEYENFSVLERSTLDVTDGDKIRITDSGSVKDTYGKRKNLHNGSTYTVKQIQDNGDLLLTNNWIVPKDYGHLDYGYCSTSHSSQGNTVDHVIIAESEQSFPAATQEQFYVSASRGRKTCKVFTDNKEALLDKVSHMKTTHHALDVWEGRQVTPSRRVQAVLTREQFLNSMPKQTFPIAPKAQEQKIQKPTKSNAVPSPQLQKRLDEFQKLDTKQKVTAINALRQKPTKSNVVPSPQLRAKLEEIHQQHLQEQVAEINNLRKQPEKPTIKRPKRLEEIRAVYDKYLIISRQINEITEDEDYTSKESVALFKKLHALEQQIEKNSDEEKRLEADYKRKLAKIIIPPEAPEVATKRKQQRTKTSKLINDIAADKEGKGFVDVMAEKLQPQPNTEQIKEVEQLRDRWKDIRSLRIEETKLKEADLQRKEQKRVQKNLNSMPKQAVSTKPKLQQEKEDLQKALNKLQKPTKSNAVASPQLQARLKQVRDIDLATTAQKIKQKVKQKLQPQGLKLPRKKKKKTSVQSFSVPEMFKNQNQKAPVSSKVAKTAQPELEQDEGLGLELTLEPDFE